MPLCGGCNVSRTDAYCTATPRLCYTCCFGLLANCCLPHFRRAGVTETEPRIANGTAPPGWDASGHDDNVGNNADAGNADSSADNGNSIDLRDDAGGPARANASSQSAVIDSLRDQLAAMLQSQQALAQQVAALAAQRSPPPELLPPPSSAPPRQPPAAAASPVRPPAPLRGAASPAAHRQEALGAGPAAAAEIHALIDGALHEPGADEDDHGAAQVSAPSHHQRARPSPASFLPAFMIPAPIGSGHDEQQVMAAALSAARRVTAKFANFTAMKQSLEDWCEDVELKQWPAERVMAVVRYHDLLVHTWGAARFQQSNEYHRLFIKDLNAGRHDMFAPRGHMNFGAMQEAGLFNVGSSSPAGASRGGGKDKGRTPGKATDAKAPASGEHPAGSCTKHPDFTTHTTAECCQSRARRDIGCGLCQCVITEPGRFSRAQSRRRRAESRPPNSILPMMARNIGDGS